jgi:Fe-S oxidoreductase
MLKSDAWFTRFQAVQGLGKDIGLTKGSAEAMVALKGGLNDSDPEVVNAVNRVLTKMGAPVNRMVFPAAYRGIRKSVSLFDLDGRQMGHTNITENVLDVRKAFGISAGTYLVHVDR